MKFAHVAVRSALVAALVFPALALAQRGGSGGAGSTTSGTTSGGADKRGAGKEADWNKVGAKGGPSGPTISAKDFQENSIYKLYIDKKKDLKLTDAQVNAFKDADNKLKDANADRFKMLDSLKSEAKAKTSGDPSAEEVARLAIARDALGGIVRDIRVSYDDDAQKATGSLDASQQKAGQELLQKYNEEMQKMIREKAGARGGPPGGGRGGER